MNKAQIITLYHVTMPSIVVWPGKVTLNVSYTRAAATQFISDYPLKYLTPWMMIEEKEIIMHETD